MIVNAGQCGCNGSIRFNVAFMFMELLVTVFFPLGLLYSEELLGEFLSACHRDGSPQKAVELVHLSTAFCLSATPNLAKRALAEFDLTEEQRWGGESGCMAAWHVFSCQAITDKSENFFLFILWFENWKCLNDPTCFCSFFPLIQRVSGCYQLLNLDSESGWQTFGL